MPLKLNLLDKKNQEKNTNSTKKKTLIMGGICGLFVLILIVVYAMLGIIRIPGLSKTNNDRPTSQKQSTPDSVAKSIYAKSDKGPSPSNASSTNANRSDMAISEKSVVSNRSEQKNTSPLPRQAVSDPFSGPYTLLGVVVNNGGQNVAIIENNSKKFVVPEKDIFDNVWVVDTITFNQVILKYNDKIQILSLP